MHPKAFYEVIKNWPGLQIDWQRPSRENGFTHIQVSKLEFNSSLSADTTAMLNDFDKELYIMAAEALLQYTRNVFSTSSMASYFLQSVRNIVSLSQKKDDTFPLHILYLSHQDSSWEIDYTTDTLFHGLRSLLNQTWLVEYPCR